MAFTLLGGVSSGSSSSTTQQSATVTFIPTINGSDAGAIVSPYAAGQGLSTLNSALPDAAGWTQSATSDAASTSTSTSGTVLLIAAAALAAWFLLRKKRGA